MPTAIGKYLTEQQVADLLGYRPATLRQSRWSGRLSGQPAPRAIKLGSAVRYEAAEIERWIRVTAGTQEVCQ